MTVTRTALVSGGNRGIGHAVATALAESGDRVAVTHRGQCPPGPWHGVRCDVTDPDQVDAAYDEVEARLGPVQVLVANAGIVRDGLLMTSSTDDFTAVVDTNLVGTATMVRRALRGMLRARHGRIVVIASSSAMSGSAGQTNYAAAKAGLIGFARSLVREIGARDITVNVVAPGWVDTDMTAPMSAEARASAAAAVPLGRFGTAGEVAALVGFLTSTRAGYVTGAVVPVDGGIGMGH